MFSPAWSSASRWVARPSLRSLPSDSSNTTPPSSFPQASKLQKFRGQASFPHRSRCANGGQPKKIGAPAAASAPIEKRRPECCLGFLRLPAQEGRHIEVVRRNIVANLADVLLDLVHDIRQFLLPWGDILDIAPRLPGLRQERWPLVRVFLVRLPEACRDHGDLHGIFHAVALHGPQNDIPVFLLALLTHAPGLFLSVTRH